MSVLNRRIAVLAATLVLLPGEGAATQAEGGPAEGRVLARELGCGACHGGLPVADAVREKAPPVGPGAPELPAEFVFTWLADPQPRRPEIAPARMPDFRLTEDERVALALYLGAEGESWRSDARDRHAGVTAADGALLFRGLGCVGCHGDPGEGRAEGADGPASRPGVGPDLSTAGARYRPAWIASFLAAPVPVRPAGRHPGTGSRMPDFRLTPAETAALAAYLASLGTGAPEGRATPAPPNTPTPWGRERAERYLTDRLSCLGCHTWRGDGGRLAPPLDGLPARLTPGAIASMVHDPAGTRPGSLMPPSPFRRGILDRVTALLDTDTVAWVPAQAPEVRWEERRAFLAAAVGSGDGDPASGAGRALYLATCAQCHGTQGDGGGFNAPYLPVSATAHSDAAAMSRRPDDTLHDGIAAGGWVLDRSHRMPAFAGKLTPDQIRSLVAYIRELCGCAPPGWSLGGDE